MVQAANIVFNRLWTWSLGKSTRLYKKVFYFKCGHNFKLYLRVWTLTSYDVPFNCSYWEFHYNKMIERMEISQLIVSIIRFYSLKQVLHYEILILILICRLWFPFIKAEANNSQAKILQYLSNEKKICLHSPITRGSFIRLWLPNKH